MKFVILSCLLGFAAASLLQQAAPVVDNSISAIWAGMSTTGSLRAALGMPDAYELDEVEHDVKAGIIDTVKDHLNKLLEKIKERVDQGKQITLTFLEKARQLKEMLRELGVNVGNKVEEFLKKIKDHVTQDLQAKLERLGLGKVSLVDLMDHVAKMNLKDIVEGIKEKILSNENIKKIREYIKNFVTNNPVLIKVKEALAKLRDVDLRELLRHLFDRDTAVSRRSIGEIWDKVKDFFKDLHITLKEKFMKFGMWVKENWDKGIQVLKDNHGTIKAIALQFIAKAKDLDLDVIKEGYEFFKNYQGDLGELFFKILELYQKAIGDKS